MEKRVNRLTEWLERLQQESWQLELLISGFLLSIFLSAKNQIDVLLTESTRLMATLSGGVVYIMLFFGFIATNILVINLIGHILLRSLWIGAIGLRNISGDIELENLNLSPVFKKYLDKKLPAFDDYIEQLENFCCLIFAYTFLLVFSILSLFLVIIIGVISLFTIAQTLIWLFPWMKSHKKFISFPFLLGYGSFGLIYLLDFILQGKIKSIAWFSKAYWPFYRFFSFISLSKIYRPLYYNMIDNPLGRKVMLSILPYILIFTLYSSISYNDSVLFPTHESSYKIDNNFYENTSDEKPYISSISLNKKYFAESDFVEVFLPFYNLNKKIAYGSCMDSLAKNEVGFNFDNSFWDGYDSSDEKKTEEDLDAFENRKAKKDLNKIECLSSHFDIFVSDTLQKKVNYDFYIHPKNKQKGILATLDIASLQRGKHFLDFKIKDSTSKVVQRFTVPFWKE
jgi:hypothetical protein